MNNTKSRTRTNGMFNPSFSSILNEIFNAPISEIINEVPVKHARPAANIVKTENGFDIFLAIPGVKKEDVSIGIEDNKLIIKSESSDSDETKYNLKEFDFTNFSRSFSLQKDADLDNISAKFDNGVLKVSVPTLEKEGPKKIEIS